MGKTILRAIIFLLVLAIGVDFYRDFFKNSIATTKYSILQYIIATLLFLIYMKLSDIHNSFLGYIDYKTRSALMIGYITLGTDNLEKSAKFSF